MACVGRQRLVTSERVNQESHVTIVNLFEVILITCALLKTVLCDWKLFLVVNREAEKRLALKIDPLNSLSKKNYLS